MKKHLSKIIFVALFTGLVGIFGVAQASAQVVTFETPFSFNIGKDKLPAGKYELKRLSHSRYALKNAGSDESHIVSFALSTPTRGALGANRLVFNRYGDTYFLRGIFGDADAPGKMTAESNAERRLRNGTERRGTLAERKSGPEKIEVELKN